METLVADCAESTNYRHIDTNSAGCIFIQGMGVKNDTNSQILERRES